MTLSDGPFPEVAQKRAFVYEFMPVAKPWPAPSARSKWWQLRLGCICFDVAENSATSLNFSFRVDGHRLSLSLPDCRTSSPKLDARMSLLKTVIESLVVLIRGNVPHRTACESHVYSAVNRLDTAIKVHACMQPMGATGFLRSCRQSF